MVIWGLSQCHTHDIQKQDGVFRSLQKLNSIRSSFLVSHIQFWVLINHFHTKTGNFTRI